MYSPLGQPTRILTRGGPGVGAAAARVTRVPPGHPEGYLEGFANIYSEIALAIKAARDGKEPPAEVAFPRHRRRCQGSRLHRSGGRVVQGQRQVDEARQGLTNRGGRRLGAAHSRPRSRIVRISGTSNSLATWPSEE